MNKVCDVQLIQTAFCKVLKWNAEKTASEKYYAIIRQTKFAFGVDVLVDNPAELNQPAEFEYQEPNWNDIEINDWFFINTPIKASNFTGASFADSVADADNPLVEYQIMNLLDSRVEILNVYKDEGNY